MGNDEESLATHCIKEIDDTFIILTIVDIKFCCFTLLQEQNVQSALKRFS